MDIAAGFILLQAEHRARPRRYVLEKLNRSNSQSQVPSYSANAAANNRSSSAEHHGNNGESAANQTPSVSHVTVHQPMSDQSSSHVGTATSNQKETDSLATGREEVLIDFDHDTSRAETQEENNSNMMMPRGSSASAGRL